MGAHSILDAVNSGGKIGTSKSITVADPALGAQGACAPPLTCSCVQCIQKWISMIGLVPL